MKKVIYLIFIFTISVPVYAQHLNAWERIPEIIKQKNSFKRFEWFYRPRTDEFGTYPKEHIDKQLLIEQQKAEKRRSPLKKAKSTSDLWTNIGPKAIDMSSSFIPYWGNVSGRVRGLDVHPTDPNIVYIGAAAGGIWKTTNGGNTWTDISGGLNRLTFGAIAIDPNNPNTIYAGTGESMWFFNDIIFGGDGLYKSNDGGNTWTHITGSIGTYSHFADIEVSPHNPNILLAALGSGNWNNSNPNNEGIWRSSDGGINWTRVLNVQDGFDIAFHPTNSLLTYAATGNQSSSGGFFRSTDGGVTWMQSNTGLPNPTSIGRIQFDLCQSNPSIFYAVIYNNTALNGNQTTAAFKSTDGGLNWTQISTGVNIAGSYDGINVNDQGWYDLCIAVHPTDPNLVYFGNVELSRTTNGSIILFVRNPTGYNLGTTAWSGYTHVDIHRIIFAPSNPNIVYLACDGGIYKSTDAGATWFSINNNINTIQFYRVASHPSNQNILFGGAQDNGNFSTNDKGNTNWVFETTGDGMECFIDYNNPNFIFMSTQFGRLLRSTDAGTTWSNVFTAGTNTAWVAPYWQHPTDFNKVYTAASRQIYRSTNRGASFSSISTVTNTNRITSVAHSPANVNRLMAVASYYTTSPRVFISSDEGINWTEITSDITSAGFTGTNIQRAVADPINDNVFYLTRASYSIGQIIKTTDFGTTWINVSGNLPQVPVNDLFIDPANTNHLYAGNDFGVYWSSNGGSSWIKLDNGMPFVPVLDFSFYDHAGTRFLRAATHGRGVYELQIDSPLPVELSSFIAFAKNNNVYLNWTTETEVNNYGFEIERKIGQNEFKKIGFVPGSGNSSSPKHYNYIDKFVNGNLTYRLKIIDLDGAYSFSDEVNVDALTINDFAVFQNYPNPFNSNTVIKYQLPVGSKVILKIYDILGKEVASLFNEHKDSGFYKFDFDGSYLSSGVYFYQLQIYPNDNEKELFTDTKKLILLR